LEALKKYQVEKAIVLVIPRGGVPVGFEVAKALAAPFLVRPKFLKIPKPDLMPSRLKERLLLIPKLSPF
jgi:predicted phosphoribosyltransferase